MMKKAVCGILPMLDGFFLSVSRKDDPNKIGFIGGKVDENESDVDALIRECLEETGLSISVNTDYPPFTKIDGNYQVTSYLITLCDEEHYMTDSNETGIVRIASRLQLIKSSPYADYNDQAFKHFNL